MCMGTSTASKYGPGLIRVRDAGFDPAEETVLTIARLIFQSFTVPDSHAWCSSFAIAERRFDKEDSGQIVRLVLNMVQSMRRARRDGFHFSNPQCPQCSLFLSENERLFMGIVLATRRGHSSALHANAMVLCEGNDTRAYLAAVWQLCAALPKLVSTGETVS